MIERGEERGVGAARCAEASDGLRALDVDMGGVAPSSSLLAFFESLSFFEDEAPYKTFLNFFQAVDFFCLVPSAAGPLPPASPPCWAGEGNRGGWEKGAAPGPGGAAGRVAASGTVATELDADAGVAVSGVAEATEEAAAAEREPLSLPESRSRHLRKPAKVDDRDEFDCEAGRKCGAGGKDPRPDSTPE